MVVRWFMPGNGERQRLLTLHIWSYGSSCYGAVNDEDYVLWFINDAKLKVRTAHRRTRGTAMVAEGELEGLEPPNLLREYALHSNSQASGPPKSMYSNKAVTITLIKHTLSVR